ncbi:hypothetical protein ACQY0O_004552 [Thecaphora frezii]
MGYGAPTSGGSPFFLEHSGLNGSSSSLRSMASPTVAQHHATSGSISPLSFERSNSYGSVNVGGSYDLDRRSGCSVTHFGPLRSNSSSTNGLASPAATSIHNGISGSFNGSSGDTSSSFVSSPSSTNAPVSGPLQLGNYAGGNKGFNHVPVMARATNSGDSRAGSFTSIGGLASVVSTSQLGGTGHSGNTVGFGERVRTSSDHSRQSSGGRGSSHGGGVAGAAIQQGPHARQSESPSLSSASSLNLPQSYLNRSRDLPDDPVEAAIHLATNGCSGGATGLGAGNGRSPLSNVSSQPGQPYRKPAVTNVLNSISAVSHLSSDSVSSSGRPPFARQSLSDGPTAANAAPASEGGPRILADSRHVSFPGQLGSPSLSLHAVPARVQAQSIAAGTMQPTTGPLSASDPRTQLLISNLPYRVRWQDLKDLFRKAGTVLRADVSLSPDNRSRGYGTVLMATEEDAIKASEVLDGFTWQGRTLEVRIDRSGALVGVAGSAATFSQPGATAGLLLPATNNSSSAPGSYLNLPQLGSHGLNSPASGLGAGRSPSLSSTSSLAASQSTATPGRTPNYSPLGGQVGSDNMSGLSDFDRGFMQGQMRSAVALQQQAQQGHIGGQQSPTTNTLASNGGTGLAHRSNSTSGSVDAAGYQGQVPWSGILDASSNPGYTPNPGGSSVPTGIPGTAAMAPWSAGPGLLGSAGGYGVQAQPFGQGVPPNTATTSYAGRVLFVGNLPFHCQWQDLKDLFRAAGNIQRADVAIGPEGRSRGFGTVLFATQEDAQNAVRLYHGYEYSGRTLKVHFDRFAALNGPAVGTPGAPSQYTGAFAAAQPPSHISHSRMQGYPSQSHSTGAGQQNRPQPGAMAVLHTNGSNNGRGYHAMQPQSFSALGAGGQRSRHQGGRQHPNGSFGQSVDLSASSLQDSYNSTYQQQRQQQQQMLLQQHQQQQQEERRQQQHQQQQQQHSQAHGQEQVPSLSQFGQQHQQPQALLDPAGFASMQQQNEVARAINQHASTPSHTPHSLSLSAQLGNGAAFLPSDLMSPGLASPPPSAATAMSGNLAHPGRIELPPLGFPGLDQMSPMHARMSVPMTPGMPGFTFQAVPETPPLYPQFLSPGLGPFSPTLGTLHVAPPVPSAHASAAAAGTGYPSVMNAAPGAPIHGQGVTTPGAPPGYNPLFPMHMAADPVQPTHGSMLQNQQPATPHWSQTYNPRRLSHSLDSPHQRGGGSFGSDFNVRPDRSVRADIARTPGAGPRRPPAGTEDKVEGGFCGHLRRASDGTPGAITPPAADGYPFPMVTGPASTALLARRASTNSPAGSPLPGGPGARRESDYGDDKAATAGLVQDALASASAEELAKTIARLSVKGAALAKDPNAKRSLSMTAERSAAASAMARLRERVGTPTLQHGGVASDAFDSASAHTSLGAPFGAQDGSDAASLSTRLRLGLQGINHPGKPSPLSNSQLAVNSPGGSSTGNVSSPFGQPQAAPDQQQPLLLLQRESDAFRAARDSLLGVSVPSSVIEAATSGSALDTSSTPSGSLKSTPNEESGPTHV